MNFSWELAFARIKHILWVLGKYVLLMPIYISVIAEGLRYLFPPLAQRLYKIPGLYDLKNYEATYKLDLAPPFSFFIFIAVSFLWERMLEVYLRQETELEGEGWDIENHATFVNCLGMVLIVADAILFYISIVQMGWSGSVISFTSFIATASYVAVLIFVCYVSLTLKQTIKDLKNRSNQ